MHYLHVNTINGVLYFGQVKNASYSATLNKINYVLTVNVAKYIGTF